MHSAFDAKVRALSIEKALAVAAYGESVAAFRYRTLCEKAPTEAHRRVFTEMAEEEQGHHEQIQALLGGEYAGADFVLSAEDKALVIVGPRTLDCSTPAAFARAMSDIHDSEVQTGNFYARFHDATSRTDLKPLLREMADECYEHAQRLLEIPGM